MPKYYNRVTNWAQVAISLLGAWSGTRCARTQCHTIEHIKRNLELILTLVMPM